MMLPTLRNSLLRCIAGTGQNRLLSTTLQLRCNSNKGALEKPPKPTPSHADSLRNAYRPNRFEQRMLVWTKKYKSLDQVPTHVNPEVMEYCRNKMRIRVANYMALATIIGCFIMIYSGKKAASRGEFVAKQNLDWHNQYNTVTDESKKE